ncbi:hypothetical protein NDR87_19770 [Nocardia sp. CDC159]|uniref:Outer membrane channel protein CpnT-like N-terminal domain-containing protein n=1 Tax=Nocardia pulmonis TaxID=2951408 RepID=A0A9X2E849_9NOCA|nr:MULTISPECIES: hypothetical protein [Nocardia]MCM6776067.1 hypothetical protein [Nocardia pulmonis]MCM6788606.1 hypothetical protein [Nocardia sp. CDC159]
MTLYLPEGLRWIGWVAGSSWPAGDEDAMWAVSAAWQAAGVELQALLTEIDTAKQVTMHAYPSGTAPAAMGQRFDKLRNGDQSLETLAELVRAVSESAFDMGTQLEATKLTIIVSLAWLALEILWAWLFPPTAPAVEAAAISTTRSFLRVFEDMAQKSIMNLARKLGASAEKRYFWKEIAGGRAVLPTAKGIGVYSVKFTESALTSMGLNSAVQLGQMAAGKRRHFDGTELGLSALASVAGAMPSREMARYLGNGIDKLAGHHLNSWWGRSARGAFIGASAGVVGSALGNVAMGAATGDWSSFSSPTGWVGTVSRGSAVGGARGLFAKSTPISTSDVRYRLWMHRPGAPRTAPTAGTAAPTGASAVGHDGSALPRSQRNADGSQALSTAPGGGTTTSGRAGSAGQGTDTPTVNSGRRSDHGSASYRTARESSVSSGQESFHTARESAGSGRESFHTARESAGSGRESFHTAPDPIRHAGRETIHSGRGAVGGDAPTTISRGSDAQSRSGRGRFEPPTSWSSSVDGGWSPPSRPGVAPPAQAGDADAAGGQQGSSDRREEPFLGAGKDMKAKTRPKRYPEWTPLPETFTAPDAPSPAEWLPARPRPVEDRVDVAFTLDSGGNSERKKEK